MKLPSAFKTSLAADILIVVLCIRVYGYSHYKLDLLCLAICIVAPIVIKVIEWRNSNAG